MLYIKNVLLGMWNAILTTPIKTFSLTFRKKLYGIESFSEIKSYLKSSSWHLERNLINTSQITIAKIPKQAIFFECLQTDFFAQCVHLRPSFTKHQAKTDCSNSGNLLGKTSVFLFFWSQNGPKSNTIS